MHVITKLSALSSLLILASWGRLAAQDQIGDRRDVPYLTTAQPITLLSGNDGEVRFLRTASGFEQACAEDSFTVIHLGPSHPPITKTVTGAAPLTIYGSPHLAITDDGRVGFMANHGWRDVLFVKGVQTVTPAEHLAPVLSAIDLSPDDPHVIHQLQLSGECWMLDLHPDGNKVIVGVDSSFHIYGLREDKLTLVATAESPGPVFSFDVSPRGDRLIVVTVEGEGDTAEAQLHLFKIERDTISHLHRIEAGEGLGPIMRGFSPRISPDGTIALVPHSFGVGGKGTLEDLLIVDLSLDRPIVTQRLCQVADGMESVAFHPSGRFAIVSCLGTGMDISTMSHLATLDLTTRPARILNYIPIEPVPEGIEFSPDGSQLFVQTTFANQVAVFDVDGLTLHRSRYVLMTGYGPSAMALSGRFQK